MPHEEAVVELVENHQSKMQLNKNLFCDVCDVN
jgi:hypothetical protein